MADEEPDEDGVLEPDELDVRDDERVSALDENRFFVSTADDAAAPDPARTTPDHDAGGPVDRPEPPRSPRDAVADADGQYAIAAAVRTDAGVADVRVDSNNVAETFEAFLRWYAGEVGDGRTPDDEVLRILLAETDLDV